MFSEKSCMIVLSWRSTLPNWLSWFAAYIVHMNVLQRILQKRKPISWHLHNYYLLLPKIVHATGTTKLTNDQCQLYTDGHRPNHACNRRRQYNRRFALSISLLSFTPISENEWPQNEWISNQTMIWPFRSWSISRILLSISFNSILLPCRLKQSKMCKKFSQKTMQLRCTPHARVLFLSPSHCLRVG